MKIVHSFWTKPSLQQGKTLEKVNGGWPSAKYHLMSWALSCLTFKEFYPNIELVTDYKGAKLFIDVLRLPYSSVSTILDELYSFSPKLWALGKIYSYKHQKEPFIHVDGDIFIWDKFSDELENAKLIAQNPDIFNITEYLNAIEHLRNLSFKLPEEISNISQSIDLPHAINAGIIGGNDLHFIHRYAERSINFVKTNSHRIIPQLEDSSFAIVYEQLLFSLMAQKENIAIKYFFENVDIEFRSMNDFFNKHRDKKYTHLLNISKLNLYSCHELEMQLNINYPEYHSRILKHLNDCNESI